MYFQLGRARLLSLNEANFSSSLGSHPPLSGYGGESLRACCGLSGGNGDGGGGVGGGGGGVEGELLREIVVTGGVSCWNHVLFWCVSCC